MSSRPYLLVLLYRLISSCASVFINPPITIKRFWSNYLFSSKIRRGHSLSFTINKYHWLERTAIAPMQYKKIHTFPYTSYLVTSSRSHQSFSLSSLKSLRLVADWIFSRFWTPEMFRRFFGNLRVQRSHWCLSVINPTHCNVAFYMASTVERLHNTIYHNMILRVAYRH